MRALFLFLCLFISTSLSSQPFHVLYHGSPNHFEQIVPHPSTCLNQAGRISWQGCAIFATHDLRVALFYTQNKRRDYKTTIDLHTHRSLNSPIIYSIQGGRSLNEAIDHLWGTPQSGYIYLLDGREFMQKEGVGSMEKITLDAKRAIGQIQVDRKKEIQEYLQLGLIQIDWKPSK